MRNVIKTKTAVVRLPSGLVDEVDRLIILTKAYTNRPDFLSCGIRNTFDHFDTVFMISAPILEVGPIENGEYRKNIICEIFRDIVKKDQNLHDYKGDPVQVNLRLPKGIYDKWNRLQDLLPFTNLQDFIRYSTARYCEFIHEELEAANRMDLIFEEDILTLQEKQEGHIQTAIALKNRLQRKDKELPSFEDLVNFVYKDE